MEDDEPPSVKVTSIMGDGESHRLVEQIKRILEEAGWEVNGVDQAIFSGSVQQVLVRVPEESRFAEALVTIFRQMGFESIAHLDDDHDGLEVIVGSNL